MFVGDGANRRVQGVECRILGVRVRIQGFTARDVAIHYFKPRLVPRAVLLYKGPIKAMLRYLARRGTACPAPHAHEHGHARTDFYQWVVCVCVRGLWGAWGNERQTGTCPHSCSIPTAAIL